MMAQPYTQLLCCAVINHYQCQRSYMPKTSPPPPSELRSSNSFDDTSLHEQNDLRLSRLWVWAYNIIFRFENSLFEKTGKKAKKHNHVSLPQEQQQRLHQQGWSPNFKDQDQEYHQNHESFSVCCYYYYY